MSVIHKVKRTWYEGPYYFENMVCGARRVLYDARSFRWKKVTCKQCRSKRKVNVLVGLPARKGSK